MNDMVITKIERLHDHLQDNIQFIVIDGDTHPSRLERLTGDIKLKYDNTDNYYQGRPISADALITELNLAGIDMAITWQNPAAFSYTRNKDRNFELLLQANQDIFDMSVRHPDRFIPAGWTDPKALGLPHALELAEICVTQFGFTVVKMNPAQNAYPIDSDNVMKIVEKIVSLGAIPAFHFGGDSPYTPAAGLEKIAKTFSSSRIIGVHMGGGGSHFVDGDQLNLDARELGLRCKNIFFVLSAKRDCHIESDLITFALAGEPFVRNLAMGSDSPYGKPGWCFGGFEKMVSGFKDGSAHHDQRLQARPRLFSDDMIQGFRGRNLADLIMKSCREVLRTHRSHKGGVTVG